MMSQPQATTKNKEETRLLYCTCENAGLSSQAAAGLHCPGKGGNRWQFNRNLIALFWVGQGVVSGKLGERLSATGHSHLEKGLAVAISSLPPLP